MENNYFIIIPDVVLECENLSPRAIILFGIIATLTKAKGYCWATNEWLGTKMRCTNKSISNWVTELEKNGFIKRIVKKVKSGYERRIYLSENAPQEKTFYIPRKKRSIPPGKNVPHSITKKSSKESKKTDGKPSPYTQVISFYFELFQEETGGIKPVITGADGKLVKNLLKQSCIDSIKLNMRKYFTRDFFFTKGGRDMKGFVGNYNKLQTSEGSPRTDRKPSSSGSNGNMKTFKKTGRWDVAFPNAKH